MWQLRVLRARTIADRIAIKPVTLRGRDPAAFHKRFFNISGGQVSIGSCMLRKSVAKMKTGNGLVAALEPILAVLRKFRVCFAALSASDSTNPIGSRRSATPERSPNGLRGNDPSDG